MFPVSGSLHAAPPFPRLGPGESGSPTSWALWRRYDLHPPHHRSLICFASGAHVIPPWFVLAVNSAPGRAEVPHQARIIVQPAIPIAGSLSRGREWIISCRWTERELPRPTFMQPDVRSSRQGGRFSLRLVSDRPRLFHVVL